MDGAVALAAPCVFVMDAAGKQSARDLWQRKELGEFADSMSIAVPAHGAELLKLKRLER